MNHRSIPSLSSSISSTDTSYTNATADATIPPAASYIDNKAYYDFPTAVVVHQSISSKESLQQPVINITPFEIKSSSSTNQENDNTMVKRHSDPLPRKKRWDDSQLEMELAEDDLIQHNHHKRGLKSVRRNLSSSSSSSYSSCLSSSSSLSSSPLRFTRRIWQLPEGLFIKQKFRHSYRSSPQHGATTVIDSYHYKSKNPLKRVREWLT